MENVTMVCLTLLGVAVVAWLAALTTVGIAGHFETGRVCIESGANWVESGCLR